jgi:4-hydroxybenzoate polyprenyltransferase
MGGALLISKTLHLIAAALLFGVWWTVPQFQGLFLAATIIVAALLVVEHATVKKWGTTKMALTFVTINGVVSLAVGLAGVIDLFTHSA